MENRAVSNFLFLHITDLTVSGSNQFEQHSLIYIPTENSWYPPTSCLWSSAPRIGNQFGISARYERLEDFFVTGLSIKAPTIATYVEQLQILAIARPPDISEIKIAIENINQLRPQSTDLNTIRQLKCLPIKMENGTTELSSTTDQFFIGDRVEYIAAFQGKLPILDYSLEDSRRLSPFLEALGLAARCMSSAIEENTTVHRPGTEPSASLTCSFREKSRYLYR
jgi:hypothetical protein